MEDRKITEMFLERSEEAVAALAEKHGGFCKKIAFNILKNSEDAEECVNDAFLMVWNSVPPNRPEHIGIYAGKIARNLALNRLKYKTAEKRGGKQEDIAFSELEECIAAAGGVERQIDEKLFLSAVNDFLLSQPKEKRNIFIRRYWYLCSVSELSESYGISESKVKSLLFRMRNQLRKKLEEEDFI
ncbi:MAG: sigma-70 family RNA polymerase sigma factor [Oscillospiraceae bacterium]|nr:sigma-70 family RNA polymerase sigma factor [Oscillospiraceae bacterium]MBQ6802033.1 sigma-70 family RNA polymerase sigma factor [Oscillospiraceae bacterium]